MQEEELDLQSELKALEEEDAGVLSKVLLFGDKLLVEQAPVRPKSAFVVEPDSSQEAPFEGTVLVVGSGKPGLPPRVRVGDYVHFGRYAGADVTIASKQYKVLREDEILFVIRDASA
jgi:chaperonin GroES